MAPIRTGLAALATLGGLAFAAHAQPPAVPPATEVPQVIKWPGGYMILNGPEVIVRQKSDGQSTNVISGVGNGVGNRIVVDNGPGGGVTIVRGSRIGVGNRLVVNPDDLLIDLDEWLKPCAKPAPAVPMAAPKPPVADPALPIAPAPDAIPPAAAPVAPPSYKGKASAFWTKKAFSDALDCNLYWCPATKLWFRYHADDDTYRPVPAQPAAPVEEK
jgi:hypothetical protein